METVIKLKLWKAGESESDSKTVYIHRKRWSSVHEHQRDVSVVRMSNGQEFTVHGSAKEVKEKLSECGDVVRVPIWKFIFGRISPEGGITVENFLHGISQMTEKQVEALTKEWKRRAVSDDSDGTTA